MKKTLLLLSVIGLSLTNQAHAKDGRFFNGYINPLGLAIGTLQGGIDFRIGDKITFGPMYQRTDYDFLNIHYEATGYGARMNYYFSGAIGTSWRLSGFGFYIPEMKMSTTDSLTRITYTGQTGAILAAVALFGGQVFIGPVNLGLGVGGGYYKADSRIILANSSGGTQSYDVGVLEGAGLAAEITVGIGF